MSIEKRMTRRGPIYEVRLRGPSGREVSRSFRTKREALDFEASQRSAKARGAWVDPRPSGITVAELSAEWLSCNPAKRASTRARDESILRVHVIPALGERKVGTLTPMDIRGLVGGWTATMAPRTVRRTYGTLRAVLNFAIETDRLVRSPCRGIKLPSADGGERKPLEPTEIARLAAAMPADTAAMVWLGAVLGLRWGEVAGLRVGRVDLLRRTVTVSEQVTRGIGGIGIVCPPKSAAGRRTLTIPSPLVEVLSAHLVRRGLTGADPDALLFPNMDGSPLDYSNWRRRVWLPAVAAAGLKGTGFHDLRRANATAMVLDGVDMKTAQTRLGHSDPRLTLAIYAQATNEGDRFAAERLGTRFMLPDEGAGESEAPPGG
jgi:integrase